MGKKSNFNLRYSPNTMKKMQRVEKEMNGGGERRREEGRKKRKEEGRVIKRK